MVAAAADARALLNVAPIGTEPEVLDTENPLQSAEITLQFNGPGSQPRPHGLASWNIPLL